ncbi:YgiQ family radical SAM protein, partial [Shigella boydii]
SDTVRRSVLVDSKADMLMFGNGERPLVEVAHRLAMGEPISEIRDVRNTAIIVKEALPGWSGVDSTRLDTPGKIDPIPHPYGEDLPCADNKPVAPKKQEAKAVTVQPPRPKPWEKT